MIFQTDLILRSALIQALRDIRSKPWTLDDIFSQAVQDPLLFKEFGYKEIQRARKWFEKTNIPVIMQHRLDKAELPCISVALVSSQESQPRSLLGDGDTIGGDIDETVIDAKEVRELPIRVLGPFTPKSYDPTTGVVTLPDELNTNDIFVGQVLLDTRNNTGYTILKCLDEHRFSIVANVKTADFTSAIVIPQFQALGVSRQRSYFIETYQLGCHVAGEPEEALWLHSIIVYILLKYKKIFLEGRGIELSTFTSSDFLQNQAWVPQNTYSRFVTLQATVEHNWITAVEQKVEGLHLDSIKIIGGGRTPAAFRDIVQMQGWEMDQDDEEETE